MTVNPNTVFFLFFFFKWWSILVPDFSYLSVSKPFFPCSDHTAILHSMFCDTIPRIWEKSHFHMWKPQNTFNARHTQTYDNIPQTTYKNTLAQATHTHTHAGSETQNIVKTGHTLLSQVCTCVYSLRACWLFGELRTWHFDKRVILQALRGLCTVKDWIFTWMLALSGCQSSSSSTPR